MFSKSRIEEIENQYQERHQVGGVSFVTLKMEPLRYGTDDDNAIYTGMYLAAASYRQACDPSQKNLDAVLGALAGLRLLTSVSGTPGVLARWAFPLENSFNLIGYDKEKSLLGDNSYGDKIRMGILYENGDHAFITKTTKDQFSGVVFGLTVAFKLVPEAHDGVAEIVQDLITRLKETKWSLVDHEGRTKTSAHKIDAPQKLILKSLHNATTGSKKRESSWFFWCVGLTTIYYNRLITRTFSYNLNAMEAHSLFLLRDHHKEKKGVIKWVKKIHRMMKKDNSPYFDVMHKAVTGEKLSDASLGNLSKRIDQPYYKFFCWSKDPERWWVVNNNSDGPGIDTLLPYWMFIYYNK